VVSEVQSVWAKEIKGADGQALYSATN